MEGRDWKIHLEKLSNFKPHHKYLLCAYYVHKVKEDNIEQMNYSYYHCECTVLERLI